MNGLIPRSNSSAIIVYCTLTAFSVLAWADPPKRPVQVRLRDNGPMAARVRILASDGVEYAPERMILRKTKQGESYFYADDSFEIHLPSGPAHVYVSNGLEYVPQSVQLDVGIESKLTVNLKRWINLEPRGWYSGDSHVHLHTGGPYAVTVADALVAARAEGLNFVNLCVSNNVGDDIRDADLITGKPHALSTKKQLLVFGEEMRSSIYGHMQFFGIKKLVEPQYTGFDDTPNRNDFPANYQMAAEACRQGGLVTYGHPMFAGQPLPFGEDQTAGNAAARELPVDAMLDVVQAVDLMCYNSDEDLSAQLWYRLLNCGLRLSACVGTDALLDRSTDPMGGCRVYVRLDGSLTMDKWLSALAKGRTFVTNGPVLRLLVAGREPGETVSLDRPGHLQVDVQVESHLPFNRVEVIVDGKVASEKVVSRDAGSTQVQVQRFEVNIPIERSSWIALRVRGSDHPNVIDGPVWAHTSPVYVHVNRQPIRNAEDAQYFVDWIGRLLRVVAARNRYANVEERQQVEAIFRRAQDQFRRRAE